MIDLSGAIWRKASGSAHNGGCVEVAANLPGVTAVRDSKHPEARALVFNRAVFAAFAADVRRGRYDLERLSRDAPRRDGSVPLSEIHDMT